MDFGGDTDPEILRRHKALLDDLENEIDALESDEEDSKPKNKSPQKTGAQKAAVATKKYKVEADDDSDFPKFDNNAFAELEKGLKMKSPLDDLEKEIMQLESDEETDEPKIPQKTQKTVVKETTTITKQTGDTVTRQVQEKVQVVSKASGNIQKETRNTQNVSFPLNLFVGPNPQKMIDNDTKYHGKGYLMSLRLAEYELEEIIEPCLNSQIVSMEVKKYLETKKKSLELFKNNITNLFQKGSLNSTKYLEVVNKMKDENFKLAKELQNSGNQTDIDRVKERLKILIEEKDSTEKSKGIPLPSKNPSTSQTKASKFEPERKKETLADSLKISPKTELGQSITLSLSEIDQLSPEELYKLLKKRKDEYWNLAMYINKEATKGLEGNDLAQKKQYLQNSIIPLIQKASGYIQAYDNNQDISGVANFLKKELVEVTPTTLHGKTLKERAEDLKKYIQLIEACIKHETEYLDKLRPSLEDANQSGAIAKKIKESEKALEKYHEYIEYLSKLGSDKYMWVPTPKLNVTKEQRAVTLLNKDVPGNSILVKFNGLENLNQHKRYWIRWSIETHKGRVSLDTPACDENSLKFNYQNIVQVTNKEKIENTIENQEIRVEIMYKQMLFEKKKTEGTIPLAPFRKTNTIEGKVKLRDEGIELSYLLKSRESLLKHIKVDVPTVHSFETYAPFDKDAPVPQQVPSTKAQSDTNQTNTSTSSQGRAVEERKIQEPAPEATGGKLFEKKKYPPLVLLPQANDPLANMTQQEIPSGLTLEQVKDPGNPDLIDCLGVLKALAEELEKARPGLAAEGRRNDNKIATDNWSKALKKATIMETKFGEGDIDPNQYVDILKASIQRDKKLFEIYKSKKDSDRLSFILEKLKLTTKELKELEEALAADA